MRKLEHEEVEEPAPNHTTGSGDETHTTALQLQTSAPLSCVVMFQASYWELSRQSQKGHYCHLGVQILPKATICEYQNGHLNLVLSTTP